MVSRSLSSVLFVSAIALSTSALVACGDDDAPPATPAPGKGGAGGSAAGAGGSSAGSAGADAGSAGSSAGSAGTAGSSAGAAGSSAGAAGSAGATGGSAGAAGSTTGPSTSGTCKRISDVVGQLDTSGFAVVGKSAPFCVVGVHAIDGDVGSDYGTVGRLGTSGKLVSNLKGGTGYVVWTPPASTPENAKQPLAKATEVPVTLTGIPDGAFFGTPSGDDAHAYLSYTGKPPEFAGELFQVALADGKVTGKATANGLYGVSPGLAANDFFFTGTSNLGAAKADPPNNGVYRGTCAAGACTGKVVKQWGATDLSGPIDTDTTGNVFVSHGEFGKVVVSSFNATAGAESAVGDVYASKNSIFSLAAAGQFVALGLSDATTFASSVAFLSYVPGSPVATLSELGADSGVSPVGKTTLSVVGGVPASKEIWIIADSNGFDPGGEAVFIRLEPAGTPKLATSSTCFPFVGDSRERKAA